MCGPQKKETLGAVGRVKIVVAGRIEGRGMVRFQGNDGVVKPPELATKPENAKNTSTTNCELLFLPILSY